MLDALVPIAFFVTVFATVVGLPLVRGMVRRWDREGEAPRMPGEVSGRLERMEHAIDAMAVEIERISEGQRFTTKLLSENRGARALSSAQGGEE
jgi:transposase